MVANLNGVEPSMAELLMKKVSKGRVQMSLNTNLKIDVTGMTCVRCEAKVRKMLEDMNFGAVVEVSHENSSVGLYMPQFIGESDIRQAIEKLGYQVGQFSVRGGIALIFDGPRQDDFIKSVTHLILNEAGVDSVDAEPDSHVVSTHGNFDLTVLVSTLAEAGYPIETPALDNTDENLEKTFPDKNRKDLASVELDAVDEVYQLVVGGMSCASCVRSVETSLATVAGTSNASVNFADQSATVVSKASLESLIAAVTSAGYTAEVQGVEDRETRAAHLDAELRRSFLASGVALLCGAGLMLGMWFNLFPARSNQWFWSGMSIAVASVMYFSGRHFFSAAFNAAKHYLTTMDTLIVLGTSTAWLYSTLVILWPEIVPLQSRHLFFEAAVLIIGFVSLGKALENNARGKTSIAIDKLLNLTPAVAIRVVQSAGGNEETEVPVSVLVVGDLVRLKPGEAVSVDGLVLEGESSVDESMLTGESAPTIKTEGSIVSAGTINQYGTLLIEAKQVGQQTVLANIVKLIRQAQNSKPEIGRITDKIAAVFVPLVVAIAILTALAWVMFGPEPRFAYAVSTAMAVLIIACPCALGLAIPMSIMVGVGRAASEGLLIKNSDALQAASGLTTIIMDKTGTLTVGEPGITNFVVSDEYHAGKFGVLRVAYSLEKLSEHPLAKAVVAYCDSEGVDVPTAKVINFEASPGGGVKGEIDGESVAIGNARFMSSHNMTIYEVKNPVSSPEVESEELPETIIYVGVGERIVGSFVLVDQVKRDSKDSILRLKKMGLKVVMLTGDSRGVAKNIAEQLALEEFVAEVSPEQKLDYIRELQRQGEKVGMVGDGVNDALALSIADVGFAMGAGTDIAIESADIALLSDSVGGVVKAILISKFCLRNIYQNLAGAFGYNLLLIPVAAGALFPWLGWLINPAFAGVAMAASSITVVANANRLRVKKI
ncbi:MAG: Cu+-exporting ATPase [Candidatus Azotimanducaceae bacterium]|jgi:Cu+-exporting ATPase